MEKILIESTHEFPVPDQHCVADCVELSMDSCEAEEGE
jgi:hypothetical protein